MDRNCDGREVGARAGLGAFARHRRGDARVSAAVYACSRLDKDLDEVARARITQLNNCSACLGSRADDMDRVGLTEDQYRHCDQ
jgi:hypothetical protein